MKWILGTLTLLLLGLIFKLSLLVYAWQRRGAKRGLQPS